MCRFCRQVSNETTGDANTYGVATITYVNRQSQDQWPNFGVTKVKKWKL